jgi:hypothetical protein
VTTAQPSMTTELTVPTVLSQSGSTSQPQRPALRTVDANWPDRL